VIVVKPATQRFRAVLFDLDGTLIDHFRIIYRCYCHALAQMGLEPVGYEKVKASVGGSIPITFGKLVPKENVDRGVKLFREHFDQIWHEEINILPGAVNLLRQLKSSGMRLAVFTNKEGNRSRKILAHTGMDQWLDGIYGTLDTEWCKPQPEFTRYALEQLGATAQDCCMIGDSPYDIEAATVVQMPCYVVATGSHTLSELRETSAEGAYADIVALGKDVFGLDVAAHSNAV
jgi:phosphoglycolate phosphatase